MQFFLVISIALFGLRVITSNETVGNNLNFIGFMTSIGLLVQTL